MKSIALSMLLAASSLLLVFPEGAFAEEPPDAAGVNLRIRSVRSAVHPYPVDSSQLIQRTAALEEQLKPNQEHTLV